MECIMCNTEIIVQEVDGTKYVLPCSVCIKDVYNGGLRVGFQLAGGDPEKLDKAYKKE